MNISNICKTINEVNSKKTKTFNDYFIDDIVRYLGIEDLDSNNELESLLRDKLGSEYNNLIKCKNKSDIKNWLNRITCYMAKYIDTEQILVDYFSRWNNLHVPTGEILNAKLCQENSKALMTNPNKALSDWLLRKVLKLKEYEILTYEKLKIIGIDSVRITKIDTENYKIDFAGIDNYDNFINKETEIEEE